MIHLRVNLTMMTQALKIFNLSVRCFDDEDGYLFELASPQEHFLDDCYVHLDSPVYRIRSGSFIFATFDQSGFKMLNPNSPPPPGTYVYESAGSYRFGPNP
jgi:hypothetical protein